MNGLPCSQNADCSGGLCWTKNRYLSFTPAATPDPVGYKVTCVASPVPGALGQIRWVGPPAPFSEGPSGGSFTGAPLQCDFHIQDWSGVGLVHVFGDTVAPGSVYTIEACAADITSLLMSCMPRAKAVDDWTRASTVTFERSIASW